MSRTVLRHHGRIVILVALATLAPNWVRAQDAAPNFALIRKTDFAGLDRQNVQKWLDRQIDSVIDTSTTAEAIKIVQETFYGREKGKEGITLQYKADDATDGFKGGMSQILSDTFQNRYKILSDNPTDQKRLVGIYLLLALNEIGRPIALPCYRLAIADAASGARALAADGLLKIRNQIPASDWSSLVPILEKAAVAESNLAVLARFYQALISSEGARVAESIATVLDGRAERFEQQGLLPTTADADAIAWLAGQVKGANAQAKNAAIGRIARVLADAVYSYTKTKPTDKQKEMLERTIMQVEKQMTELAALQKSPDITAAMLEAGSSQADKMSQQLDAWVGTAAAAGALNEAPFNLPRGLNIKRPAPPTTSTTPA